MNFKKNLKRFMTLNRHHAEGFTLVELIVVIAILAILGGVAVPAYGGYVKKANKEADLALVSEIQQALILAYYANPSAFEGGAIVGISTEGATNYEDPFAGNAMAASFGDSWAGNVKLKYDGWKSKNIEISNFKGKETHMLDKVDKLTTGLADAIEGAVGDNFNAFLSANGINPATADKTTKSNATVMYVANNTANLSNEQQAKIMEILAGNYTVDEMPSAINEQVFGGNDLVSSAAVMYAIAEAFAAEQGTTIDLNYDAIYDVDTAAAEVSNTFKGLAKTHGAELEAYRKSQKLKDDVNAYVDILSTVNNAKSQVMGKLDALGTEGGPTWSSAYGDLFVSYANGGAFVFLSLDENGAPVVGSTLVED